MQELINEKHMRDESITLWFDDADDETGRRRVFFFCCLIGFGGAQEMEIFIKNKPFFAYSMCMILLIIYATGMLCYVSKL